MRNRLIIQNIDMDRAVSFHSALARLGQTFSHISMAMRFAVARPETSSAPCLIQLHLARVAIVKLVHMYRGTLHSWMV